MEAIVFNILFNKRIRISLFLIELSLSLFLLNSLEYNKKMGI